MHLAILCHRLNRHNHAGRQALMLANEYARRGHRVTLLCCGAVEAELAKGVELICYTGRLSRMAPGLVMFRRWLTAELERLAPDHTLSTTTLAPAHVVLPCDGTAASHARALRTVGAPFPARVAAWLLTLMPRSILHRYLEAQTLRDQKVRAIVADHDVIHAQLLALRGVDQSRLVRLAPALPDVSYMAEQSASLRQRLSRGLGLSLASRWIVLPFDHPMLGGLEPAMLAFKALVDGGADVVLLLAGRWRYTHLSWVAQLGLRDRVRFLGKPDEPACLIAACDLLISPATYDPAGAEALLALSLGRPVVVSQACGAAPWVGPGQGVVTPTPVNPEALASAIRTALNLPPPASTLHLPLGDRVGALLTLLTGVPPG